MQLIRLNILIALIAFSLLSCNKPAQKSDPLFETLDAGKTGLQFSNRLTASPSFNMLKYMYFYNGAGVGAGDFNNDGLVDLFFASNQSQNTLYINKGKLQFEDVTKAARIPADGGWSTGISVADVNNDGMLDIYVCRVGNYESLHSRNQLLICKGIDANGIPFYADEAKAYAVDFSGFSTQAAFLDYDLDGDLDMFLLNHSLRYNSTFAPRTTYVNTSDSLSGDILFRNDGNRFSDVSKEAGILQSVIGYGLGIAVADINLDGWPDMYIGNDFHENDYLYINNHKGGFTEELTSRISHTSQFSMGVDVADMNNDAWPEIIAADMLPSDPYILRRSLGEDEYNTFQIKIRNGYNHQYARNTLQLNRGNGQFSETGLYSGISATDWSWSTLFMDFNNDGKKDLFISNGIPKRLNDIDYVNYISNEQIQSKIRTGEMGEKDMALIDQFPQIKLPNRFFINKGDLSFEDAGEQVKNNSDTYSNGAVYADLDNDGDLDIVVNNIDETALVYRNTSNDNGLRPAVRLELEGSSNNKRAVGTKLIIYSGDSTYLYEKFPVKGFQSAMELPLQAAIPARYDSILLIWPDNHYQPLKISRDSVAYKITYQSGLPLFDYASLSLNQEATKETWEEISKQAGLNWLHQENLFVEFDRESLQPFMASQEGPALAVGDVNGDQLEDFFIGSSKWEKSALFLQQAGGTFMRSQQESLIADSTYEDIDACWADFNQDGFTDLAVASGGNEYYGKSEYLLPRLYLNDGKGKLIKKEDAFRDIFMTASCILAHDFNRDGKTDLFIGGRAVPFQYGAIPRSYILLNNGAGIFSDQTATLAPELLTPGMVKGATLTDLDNDKDTDLVLALEWGPVTAFINEIGKYKSKVLTNDKGWWNFVLPFDADGDGDMDLLAGNQGLNSRFRASAEQPVRLYYFDADNNGKKEQIITYYLGKEELLFANKSELEKQVPSLKKKYLYAADFAKASPADVFGKDKLRKAAMLEANYLANAIFINNGNLSFTVSALPWQTQLTSYRDAVVMDENQDGQPDILLAGNFYPNNIQMGRYDADQGSLLINKGKGQFTFRQLNGFVQKGEVRKIRKLQIGQGSTAFLLARNHDSLQMIRRRK
ncbi:MAG: VCBS repeat-containing protein [Chitinophagaceae bacterium]|nr:VCBS repeat-containing protein [Chitinophagaceae bacterium]